uniref:Uncharacterized protein n=1 Tax=Schlesneria paludicola TaxID=360056 RepID=A0A7C2K097_9PLAN
MSVALCLLVLLGTNAAWLSDQVRVLPTASLAVLAPTDSWRVPLSLVPTVESLSEWPFLAVAAAAAVLIALACRDENGDASLDRLFAAVGLCLLMQPSHLLSAGLLLLLSRETHAQARAGAGWRIAALVLAGVLGTLEFGLLLLLGGLALVGQLLDARKSPSAVRSALWPVVVLAAGAGLACAVWPGFAHAALRPVSWLWIRPPAALLPALSPMIASPTGLLALILLLPFWSLQWWAALSQRDDAQSLSRLVSLMVCHVMGLGCLWYSFLTGVALVSLHRGPARWALLSWRPRTVLTAAIAVALGRVLLVTDTAPLLAGAPVQRLVQPTAWNTSGPVLLLNLGHTADGRQGTMARQLPLLVDDRWDCLGSFYPTYAAICRDLREVRDFRYLRTDGEWGGYTPWIQAWSPALLAVDSTDTESIRGLSLSTDWRVMGIDGRRTLFGRADEPRNLPQMRQALNCLLTLEWPARLSAFSLENTILSGNAADDRIVAGALCGLRFPYAGLRFLRNDRSTAAERVRVLCHLELAHRVSRYASQGSLLDQYRAVVLARRYLHSAAVSAEDRTTIERALQTLTHPTDAPPFPARADEPPPERELRSALLNGDEAASRRWLKEIEPPLQPLYQALINAPARPAQDVYRELQEVVKTMADTVSAAHRGEAQFYLGCAAIEAGESLMAIGAFEESARLAPNLPFREIRGVYLGQLTR